MKRVILTGANGFIGRQAIAPLLARNYEVHAVSNVVPTADLIFENVVWHQVNLLDNAETAEFIGKIEATHLLHFAWYVEHGKFWNAPENYVWKDASLNLIKKFSANGGERVVVSGTCAEYEWGNDAVLSEKNTPLNPQNIYGQCKFELQRELQNIDLSSAWGRIFFLYGQYESPNRLVASVINSLLRDEFANCSHGNQIRDFLYVKEIADAFAALLDSDVNDCVNIASGDALRLKDLILTIAELIGKTEKVRFGAIAAQENEPESIVADTLRLTDEVKWKPATNLSEGLTETIEWWKKN